MGQTRELAQFGVQLQYSDLPEAVIERAKELALHAWGVQLAGSTLPWSKSVYRYAMEQGGTPRSTVVSYGSKTSAVNAALVNGTFGHGFEMDDNHAKTGIKGGCVVIPAGLALAEQQFNSGREFILATVTAYEIMLRVALSVHPFLFNGPFHPNGNCGSFGSAVAAGKLLRFDEQTLLQAISIAAGHAGGLKETPISGRGNLKRLFGGMAASNGLRAALLAKEGLTGPVTMLEGEHGFCRAYSGGSPNLPALTDGLGKTWEILNVHYKIYAQDGFIQPMTEAMDRILQRHRFKPEDVVEIRAGTNKVAHERVVGVVREPKDLTSSQFSANYSLALFLVTGGAGFNEYTEQNLTDPRIVELSKKIRTEIDEEIELEYQKTRPRGARITVKLKSGETLTECVPSLRAMTPEDVNQKFRSLAAAVISEKQADRLMQLARGLDSVRDVSCIAPLLVR